MQASPTPSGATPSPLGRDLERIAQRAARVFREQRIRSRAIAAVDGRAFLLLMVIPLLQIVAFGVSHLWAAPVSSPAELPVLALLGLTLAVPAIYVLFHAYRAAQKRWSTRQALAEVDRRLQLKDRLQTAAQFLADPRPTPFMQAAMQDAAQFTERALEQGWVAARDRWQFPSSAAASLVAALVLFLFASWLNPYRVQELLDSKIDSVARGVAHVGTPSDRRDSQSPEPKPELAEPRSSPTPRPREEGVPIIGKPGKPQQDESGETQKTRGKTQAGASANSSFSSGSSEARGNPTAQPQSSQASDEKPPKKKQPKKKKPPKESSAATQEKKEEDSGATAGRGAASGSNKSPSISTWSSKDQVTSEDEEDLEDDEEVDDEFDENDARGGVQPQLRDRKPPVNRDLTLGFGNGKNPDANGRGGPSQQKKSRGVASLVLGVPIPDHIKGRPNPGKTKVTQERVEPQVEESDAEGAADRGQRENPVGPLATPELTPWMRDFVKRFHLSARARGEQQEQTQRP